MVDFEDFGSPEAAREAGAIFYSLPSELTDEMIDPLLRKAVRRINESNWIWTAESCQGHPEEARHHPWAGNVRPFLRLVVHGSGLAEMMAKLVLAMRYIPAYEGADGKTYYQTPESLSFKVFPWPTPNGDYEQVLIYIEADSAYGRNLGIAAFERFAESL